MSILKQLTLFKKFYLSSHTATGPEKQRDFTMHLEPVDLDEYNHTLQNSVLTSRIVQTIHYKERDFPIFQLGWGDASSDKRLLILAGVHGNEIAGALAVLDILEDVKQNASKYASWSIRIIAPVNPVGMAYQSRYNEEGIDINRDFKGFRSVGAQIQRDAIGNFKPTIVVTLHESPDEGFHMFSEGKLPTHFKNAIGDELLKEKIHLATKNFLHMRLKNGIWEKSRFIFFIQRLLGIHTLGRYLYERRIPALTTESTWGSKDMAARRRPHMLVVRALLEKS